MNEHWQRIMRSPMPILSKHSKLSTENNRTVVVSVYPGGVGGEG